MLSIFGILVPKNKLNEMIIDYGHTLNRINDKYEFRRAKTHNDLIICINTYDVELWFILYSLVCT